MAGRSNRPTDRRSAGGDLNLTHRCTIGSPSCYNGSVARHPYTDENRAAHGNIRQLVECKRCGARRLENRNQRFLEVSPWWDERSRRERERNHALEAKQAAEAAIATIRRAYGDQAALVRTGDDYIALWVDADFRNGGTEILIGTSLADAAARTKGHGADKIRGAVKQLRAARLTTSRNTGAASG